MEIIRNLITRLRHTGALFLVGVLLIVYISLGFLYVQQDAQQRKFEGDIAKLSLIVTRGLPGGEELRAEYEKVNLLLAPMTNSVAIALLVDIADRNGIDTTEDSGNFLVPSAGSGKVKVGEGTYWLVTFRNVRAKGTYDNVMAFISDLNSGKTLETMVLKKVTLSEAKITFTGPEGARRAEFRTVALAVEAMMNATGLQAIPNPRSFTVGVATNLMGDDSDTEEVVEGFPDIFTTPAERGYSGNATPRAGYVLYEHDRISTDNTTQFEAVSYINMLTTEYYYTCEADGTVRQFDRPDVATAIEYRGSEEAEVEAVASVDVDIYTKLKE